MIPGLKFADVTYCQRQGFFRYFRTMTCSSLIESGLWSRDALEWQVSHMERYSVRAAYIHKVEFIDERKLMLQWWAYFMDAHREKGITPFDYAQINRGYGE